MGMADWEVKYELGRDLRRAKERIAELEQGLRDIAEHCHTIRGGAPPHIWIPAKVRSIVEGG